MTQWDKLLDRMSTLPNDVRFDELDRILRFYGYSSKDNGTSHYVYRKKGSYPITIPRHYPIKKAYIRQVLAAIHSEMEQDDEKDSQNGEIDRDQH